MHNISNTYPRRPVVHNIRYVAFEVCCDFTLPGLVASLAGPRADSGGEKRDAAMSTLYAFCADEASAHVGMIKRLQASVADQALYVRCLVSLVHQERSLSGRLGDLYRDCCALGLGLPSPSVRAASVSMVPQLQRHAPEAVESLVPTLERLMNDRWWEVQAQLLVASAAIMGDAASSSAALVVAEAIVEASSPPPRPHSPSSLALLPRGVPPQTCSACLLMASVAHACCPRTALRALERAH